MTLYTALSEVPAGYGPSVVTIGNFDGVHRGHARVISRVVSLAEEHGLSSIAVSFDPHPMQVHRPEVPHHDIMGQGSRRYFMCLLVWYSWINKSNKIREEMLKASRNQARK